jgi:CMP-N-acetylneuraminic acid synthetase/regulator of RNase E activity RraA
MKIVAIIPVKSTSTRVKNKNIRLLGGKPLFIHTLDKLSIMNSIDEVWIDTDSLEIIELANNYGCSNYRFFIRDKKYATNATDGNVLLQNEINNIKADIYLQILCTSPFTKTHNIEKCIDLLKDKKAKSVIGCYKKKMYVWENSEPLYDIINIPNSCDLGDTVIESMSLYGITKEEFMKTKMRVGSSPYLLELSDEESIDIDYENDFVYANKIAKFNAIDESNFYSNIKLKLNSCIISDILNELGYANCVLKDFKMNMHNAKLFGRVKPIQIRELNSDEDPNGIYKCLNSYNSIIPGDIIFVNNMVDKRAYFGDLNATIAITKQAQGTIINGYTRDIDRTIELGYPVFYKDNICSDVKLYGTLDYYDKPIQVNGINIYVNDLMFADNDGVVIIPRIIEKTLLEKSVSIIKNENKISSSLIFGESLDNIIHKNGTF